MRSPRTASRSTAWRPRARTSTTLDAVAYLELHIEQGPVLQEMKKPVGVVLGTMGVERYNLKFIGQAAHSGAAPIHLRKDAFLAAAEFALACRDDQRQVLRQDAAHARGRDVRRGQGRAELRDRGAGLDGDLDRSARARRQGAEEDARRCEESRGEGGEDTTSSRSTWSPLLQHHAAPVRRDADGLRARRDRGGHRQRTGAAVGARCTMRPRWRRSCRPRWCSRCRSPGVSHTRIEDTPRPALDKSIRAFLITVDRTIAHHAAVKSRRRA